MAKTRLDPIHPGEILLEKFLKPMGISQYRVAKDIGVPPRRINEIVHGKRAVKPGSLRPGLDLTLGGDLGYTVAVPMGGVVGKYGCDVSVATLIDDSAHLRKCGIDPQYLRRSLSCDPEAGLAYGAKPGGRAAANVCVQCVF